MKSQEDANRDDVHPTSTSSHHDLTLMGVPISFPFSPYQAQLQLMLSVIKTLNRTTDGRKCNALLESPTGTGKTLSLLCAVLAWREHIRQQNIIEYRELFLCTPSEAIAEPYTEGKFKSGNVGSSYVPPPAPSQGFSVAGALPPIKADRTLLTDTDKRTIDKIQRYVSLGLEHSSLIETEGVMVLQRYKNRLRLRESGQENAESVTTGPRSPLPKIFYGTRTHSQIKQVVHELRRTSYRPHMCILSSREQTCIHDVVKTKPNKNDECIRLLDLNKCPFYRSGEKLSDHEAIQPGGSLEVFDIEDLVALGNRERACPYFAMRSAMSKADIVFCPYNYLVDPVLREAIDIDITDAIIVIDEAHNIEDVCRAAVSKEIRYEDLEFVSRELNQLIEADVIPHEHRKLLGLVDKCIAWLDGVNAQLQKEKKKQSRNQIFRNNAHKTLKTTDEIRQQFMHPIGITENTMSDIMNAYNQAISRASVTKNKKEDAMQMTNKTATILEMWAILIEYALMKGFIDDYRVVVELKQIRNQARGRVSFTDELWLNMWCMNPAASFTDLKKMARSVILTSGTLSPMASFSSELDCQFDVILETDHVVDPRQVVSHVVNMTSTDQLFTAKHADLQRPEVRDALGDMVLEHAKNIPFGMLVFMPSYGVMAQMKSHWEDSGLLDRLSIVKKVFFEPQGTKKDEFKKMINEYYGCIDECERMESQSEHQITGAIMFAAHRGKVSEGINFSDNMARAVLLVGIPYPSFGDINIVLKREWNDQHRLRDGTPSIDGTAWYELQAFRALNQAIGRCLRHKYDYGAIILIDSRFTWQKNSNQLSKWIRSRIQRDRSYNSTASAEVIREFFKDITADPPIRPAGLALPSFEDDEAEEDNAVERQGTQSHAVGPSLTYSQPKTSPSKRGSKKTEQRQITLHNFVQKSPPRGQERERNEVDASPPNAPIANEAVSKYFMNSYLQLVAGSTTAQEESTQRNVGAPSTNALNPQVSQSIAMPSSSSQHAFVKRESEEPAQQRQACNIQETQPYVQNQFPTQYNHGDGQTLAHSTNDVVAIDEEDEITPEGNVPYAVCSACSLELLSLTNEDEDIFHAQVYEKPSLLHMSFTPELPPKDHQYAQVIQVLRPEQCIPNSLLKLFDAPIPQTQEFKLDQRGCSVPLAFPTAGNGASFTTGFLPSDGCMYNGVICPQCLARSGISRIIGVKIVAADYDNADFIGAYMIFENKASTLLSAGSNEQGNTANSLDRESASLSGTCPIQELHQQAPNTTPTAGDNFEMQFTSTAPHVPAMENAGPHSHKRLFSEFDSCDTAANTGNEAPSFMTASQLLASRNDSIATTGKRRAIDWSQYKYKEEEFKSERR